ncbi:MAG: hypothetical protein QM730_04290 [Anaerolineales bacterium]
MVALFTPDDVFLLAQENMALLLCIDDNHYYHCSDCCGQEDFHAPRIAWTHKNVLYSGFAISKQLCKGKFGWNCLENPFTNR